MSRERWSRIDSIVLILAALGLSAFLLLYSKSFPEAGIRQPLSEKQIVERAKEFLVSQNLDSETLHNYPAFVHDAKSLHYYQVKYGIKKANEIIRNGKIPVFYWEVNFRAPINLGKILSISKKDNNEAAIVKKLTKDTLLVELTANGEILGFQSTLPVDSVSEIPADIALEKAKKYLREKSNISLADFSRADSIEVNGKPSSVYNFVWKKVAAVDSFTETVSVKLVGARVTEFSHKFDPPEIYEDTSNFDEIRGILIVFFTIAISIFLLILLIYKLRNDQVELKHNLLISGFVTLCWVILLGTGLIKSETRGLLLFLMPILFTTPFVFFGFLIASSLGESEARDVWPEKLLSLDMFRSGNFSFPQWSMAILRGFSLAFISLGLIAIGIQLLDWKFDFFIKIDNNHLYKKFSMIPIFYIAFQSVMNVGFGESIFRLFTLSYLKRILKKTALIFPIALLLWVFTFGSYADIKFSSFWFSFLLNSIVGALFIYFFLKWDFLTVIWGALTFYLVYELHPFLYFENPTLVYNGYAVWMFLFAVLLISIPGLRAKVQKKPVHIYIPDYKIRQQERERIARELEIARQVQSSFLPEKDPKVPGLDIASICLPALEVGGDYYDFIRLDENKLGIVIGDVSGKGIPAAFHMTLTKGFLKSQARLHLSPREVLIHLNELFCENVKRGTFISMIYGVVDTEKMVFRFARAGHNPLLVKKTKDQELFSLCPNGLALGLASGKVFETNIEEFTLDLNPGDVIMFYTDGFSEAMNPEKDEFGEPTLEELLKESKQFSADEILNKITVQVTEFVQGARQHDDMTMIVMKVLD